ncbi:SurA N-terminal domain-containing protein [Rhodomicrobium sp. Az07]|uniref:SurA N-terminal domain-containing protein n=1 Tax=Rhodomicrobium sp. Az07 TaxID=2839034 RepID=UPI001BE7DBAE|nr:SurA N-terminal domain-containing protein [Rhodomicrobium sp. Az07]MBT3070098.1 SurA N-terminal domain-containing protein [Rhodomicrobium sp. Az07]
MHFLRKVAVFFLFAILIGAFAISMGGNYYGDRERRQSVATVGSANISPEDFRRAYQRVLENVSQQAGRRISAAEAQAFGLPNRVLQGLIQDAALDLEAKELGVGLSEEGVRRGITSLEVFQDKGEFSADKYHRFLQSIGYSAPFFEQEFKGDLMRRQLRGVFDGSGVVSKALLDAYNKYGNEQRTLAYFTLTPEAAGAVPAPTEAELEAFFENRKPQFMTTELRKVSALAISPQIVAKTLTIPDEDLKAEYTAKSSVYSVPERRKLEIVPFKTRADAEAAFAKLKSGARDLLGVAKDAGFSQPDIDAGVVSKQELADRFGINDAIVKTAFSTEKEWTARPVDGPVSTVIIRVLDVIPGQEQSFDQVKEKIRADLAKTRAQSEFQRLIKAFEEDRTTGIPLADSAKKLNLPLEDVTIDRSANGADGKPVTLSAVPAGQLADAAFKSDVGVENEAIRLPGGGYAWFEVADVVKPRQKPLEEVKGEVEAAWRADQVRDRLASRARDLVARLDKGEPIAAVAKSAGATVKTSQPLKRNSKEEGIPPAAVAQAFTLPEGGAASAASENGTSRAIFQVVKITPPGPLSEEQAKGIEQQLAGAISDDNFSGFLNRITTVSPISIDRKAFANVAGGSYDGE